MPWFELISIVLFSRTLNVKGCSGNVFKVSISSLAGTAKEPVSAESILISALRVVSKSDAVIFKRFSETSNKK